MYWILTFIFLLPLSGLAQVNLSYIIQNGQIEALGQLDPEMGEDFHSSIILQKAPNPETIRPEAGFTESANQYENSAKVIIPAGERKPSVEESFTGNSFDFRVPNDNSIAVSNEGRIVSVINASVNCFDGMGLLSDAYTLDDLAQPLGLNELKYDPRVIYDPGADRFVLVFLNGFADTTSQVVVAFSMTNNPEDGWRLYALPGNPHDDQSKSDFPAISITKEHLYITLNVFDLAEEASEFREGVIWKVAKQDGYKGQLLNYSRIEGIAYGGKPFFSLYPVQPGRTLFGPDMFFVGNRGTAASNDTIFLMQLQQRAAKADTLIVKPLLSPLPYSFPPLAMQPGTKKLETNDARITGAFLHNDCLQFVATSAVPSTERSGIFHGIIWDPADQPMLDANILHLEELDCGYPNIATTATEELPYASMITYNYSSPNDFPGFATIFYDNHQPYSGEVILKEGVSSVTIQPGEINRWGDYTGIQPKYDTEGVVWAAGSYGKNNTHNTWISRVHAPVSTFAGAPKPEVPALKAYPNPFEDQVSLQFSLESAGNIRVELFDTRGDLIELFSRGSIMAGNHTFRFSTDPLPPGIYLISITNEKGELLNSKKVVKQ